MVLEELSSFFQKVLEGLVGPPHGPLDPYGPPWQPPWPGNKREVVIHICSLCFPFMMWQMNHEALDSQGNKKYSNPYEAT